MFDRQITKGRASHESDGLPSPEEACDRGTCDGEPVARARLSRPVRAPGVSAASGASVPCRRPAARGPLNTVMLRKSGCNTGGGAIPVAIAGPRGHSAQASNESSQCRDLVAIHGDQRVPDLESVLGSRPRGFESPSSVTATSGNARTATGSGRPGVCRQSQVDGPTAGAAGTPSGWSLVPPVRGMPYHARPAESWKLIEQLDAPHLRTSTATMSAQHDREPAMPVCGRTSACSAEIGMRRRRRADARRSRCTVSGSLAAIPAP